MVLEIWTKDLSREIPRHEITEMDEFFNFRDL